MIDKIFNRNQQTKIIPVNKTFLIDWIDDLYRCLFGIGEQHNTRIGFETSFIKSQNDFRNILDSVFHNQEKIYELTQELYAKIPAIHDVLLQDLDAIYAFDPAAKNKSEVIFSYPGFYAIAVYRISHELWTMNIPVIPRIISEYVHNKTGIDIHPGATIGSRFFIDHGTGIVIGETACIGDDVKIYQGVTLGALNVKKEDAEIKRHPTIENDVIIYANATILGGNTTIGSHSIIGGNVWISSSIPKNSLVFNKSEIIIKDNKVFPEPLNYVI